MICGGSHTSREPIITLTNNQKTETKIKNEESIIFEHSKYRSENLEKTEVS